MSTHTESDLHLLGPDLIRHDLKKHRKLWIDSYHTLEGLLFDGIPGFTAPTVFYLVCRGKRNPALMQLAAGWRPESVAWLSAEERLDLMDRYDDAPHVEKQEVLMVSWEG